jgi:hypothetical protein
MRQVLNLGTRVAMARRIIEIHLRGIPEASRS